MLCVKKSSYMNFLNAKPFIIKCLNMLHKQQEKPNDIKSPCKGVCTLDHKGKLIISKKVFALYEKKFFYELFEC